MIVLVGTSSTVIKKGEAKNVACPYCNSNATINYKVHCKYASITFIPLFPVEKFATMQCSVCGNEIALNDLSDGTISRLASENNDLKNPIWTFFGSFVLVCCLGYFIYNYFKTEDKTKLLVKNPMIEDVYYMKDAKGYYYTLRIDTITKDSIYTTENDYQVDAPYDIDDINVPENYTNQKSNFSKKELITRYDSGEIISIKRD